MPDPVGRLAVLLHSRPVADLERSGRGLRLSFRDEYLDDEARVPLSLSLPAETGPHRGDAVAWWIDGLLPGRREVRERWRDHYGAASADAFDLLSTRVGHDCAGAVQFSVESGEEALWNRPGGVRWLSDAAFQDLILEMSSGRAVQSPRPHPALRPERTRARAARRSGRRITQCVE